MASPRDYSDFLNSDLSYSDYEQRRAEEEARQADSRAFLESDRTFAEHEDLKKRGEETGRLGTAVKGFARSIAQIPGSLAKSIDEAGARSNMKMLEQFDRIDSGDLKPDGDNLYMPSFGDGVGMDEGGNILKYARADAEGRARIRARYADIDPRDNTLYKAGQAVNEAVENITPVNPKYSQEFWSGQVPQGLGSMLGFAVTGYLAKRAGMNPTSAAAIPGAGVGADSQFQDALNSNATLEQALESVKYGAQLGLTEGVPIGDMLNRLDKITGGGVKRLMIDTAKQGTEEAIQEFVQTVGSNMVANDLVGYDKERGTFTGSGEAAGVGFTVGGLTEFALGLLSGRHRAGRVPPPAAGAQTPPAPPSPLNPNLSPEGQRERIEPTLGPQPTRPPTQAELNSPLPTPGVIVGTDFIDAMDGRGNLGPTVPPPPPGMPPGTSAVPGAEPVPGDQPWEAMYDEDDNQIGEWNRVTGKTRPTQPKTEQPNDQGIVLPTGQQEIQSQVQEPAQGQAAQQGDGGAVQGPQEPARNDDGQEVLAPPTLRTDGKPWPSEKAAIAAARMRKDFKGKEVEAVPVEGGYGLRLKAQETPSPVEGSQVTAGAQVASQPAPPTPQPPVPASGAGGAPPAKPLDQSMDELGALFGATPATPLAPVHTPHTDQGDGTRAAPVEITTAADMDAIRDRIARKPTDGQKDANNYAQGHATWNGLKLGFETPRGGERRSKTTDAVQWVVPNHPTDYGKIKGFTAPDGDEVDLHMGPNPESKKIFVIDQYDTNTNTYDEPKVMGGFDTMAQAQAAYDAAFTDGKGPQRRVETTETDLDGLNAWLPTANKPVPFADSPQAKAPSKGQEAPSSPPDAAPSPQPSAAGESADNRQKPAEPDVKTADSAPGDNRVLSTGARLKSKSGREMSPVPKIDATGERKTINTLRRVDEWLLAEAKKEAEGQKYLTTLLSAINVKNMSQSDRDTLNEVLFGGDGATEANLIKEGPAPGLAPSPGPAAPAAPPQTLMEFLSQVGIKADDPALKELTNFDVLKEWRKTFSKNILRADGQPLLQAIQRAHEAGFLGRRATAEDTEAYTNEDLKPLDEALFQLARGKQTVRDEDQTAQQDAEDARRFRDTNRADMEQIAEGHGIDPQGLTDADLEALLDAERAKDAAIDAEERAAIEAVESELQQAENAPDEEAIPFEDGATAGPPGQVAREGDDEGRDGQEAAPQGEEAGAGGGEGLPEPPGPVSETPSQEPSQEVEPPRVNVLDVGERLEGARKHAFDQLDAATKAKIEASEQVKALLEETSRSALFPIALDAEASNGTRAYLERVRGTLKTFLDTVNSLTGGRKGAKSRWMKRLSPVEAITKFWADGTEQDRIDIVKKAAEYTAFVRELENITKNALTIEEAEKALARAMIEDYDASLAQWEARTQSYAAPSKFFKKTKFGEQYDDFSSKTYIERHFAPDDYYHLSKGLVDDIADDDTGKAKPLRPPKIDNVVREGLPERRKDNRNVTPEDFMNTFGFRGVQFGNYVNQAEGMRAINAAYDALLDLADTLGFEPKNIGFPKDGKRMGIAFGARGQGGKAAAHYEPSQHVINITKNSGDGTLAHEWMHALDYALRASKTQSGRYTEFVNQIKNALQTKYSAIDAVNQLDRLLKGESWINNDKRRGPIQTAKDYIDHIWHRWNSRPTTFAQQAKELGAYWKDPVELWARAGEAAIYDMIPGKSPYLVSDWVSDSYVTKSAGYRGQPYPSGDERVAFSTMFANFFGALRFVNGEVTIDDAYRGPSAEMRKPVQDALDEIGKDLPGRRDRLLGRTNNDNVFVDPVERAKRFGKPSKYWNDDTLNRQGLGLSFADFFTVETNKFASISAAQRMAEDLVGGAITAPGDIKAVEEAVELGAVIAGRRIYERMSRDGADHATIFQAMVDLYYRQPPLLTRTSTSATNQAYSTPVPMAYLANVLARVTPEDTLYEPTAGQGALAITAHAPFVQANELDAKRAQSLILQGFQVTTADAMTNRVSGADVVIANPPFGTVKNDKGEIQTFKTEKFDTTAVDHAIALKALESMRENGRAVLIIAGQKHLGSDPDGARRQALYNTPKNRAFFKYLFDTYNVTEHFTIDGALYKRQGAAWPIDVIVINGRGKSELKLPGAQPPKTYESFDDLKALLNGTPHGATERELDTEAVGLGAGRPAADVGGSESAAGPDDGTGVAQRPGSPGAGPNQPGTGRSGNRGPRAGGGGRAAAGPEEQEGMGGDAVPGGAGDQADAQSEQPDVAGPSDAVGPRGGDIAPGDDAGKLAERDQRLSDLENFDDIFDEALGGPAAEDLTQPPSVTLPTQGQGPVDEAEGTPRPQPRTVGEASKSAAINTAQGLDDALSGLSKLFGADPTRMTSGIGFDPETYKKAKPLFLDALAHFKGAAVDVKAMVAAFVNHARNVAKWADDVIQRMKPYLKQFITEALDGRIPGFGPQVKRRENTEIETSFQTRYEPASNATPVGTLIPSNMKTSVIEALESLSKRQGDLDTYVAQKIGMTKQQVLDGFSAEQVDALALAIDNVEQGKGFIIGDQTGVGKGRFVAGMIKYALTNGITPIFVTKDAKLFGDMYRDTADIGMGDEFKPLMTNINIGVALDDGRVVRSLSSARNQTVMNEVARTGKLPAGYNVLMTTYSQLQTKGGVKVPRHHAIEALANGAMMILDEAHEAGGTDGGFKKTDKNGNVIQTRSEYVRELIAAAKGTVYSSATYAKNPHVMTLYFKTDMADAVENIKDLSETIKRGGVPLQQVVANMLVRAGQYLRRERSFEGVQFGTKKSDLDMDAYRSMASLLREIFALDSQMTEVREKYGAYLAEEGEGLGDDNAVGEEGVTSATFSSMMHNIISQTLMALKADAAAQEAIDAWKAGKKPVIALANTMGSFLEDHMERHNLKTGSDVTAFTPNQLFLRYLDRTRTVSIKDAYDKKKVTKHFITDGEMEEMGYGALVTMFEHVASLIEAADLSTVPASPIDHIREKMQAAGMKVDEITGRQVRIETRNGVKKAATRQATIAEKGRLVNAFNSGTIDGLIINRSGSTGLSMHASVKYKDQKPRVMILVQADPNIDVFMQMLGRIHRTGQVVPPEYILLSGNVPSERRPAAITAGKMKSLNANTSANSDSAFTDSEALDFMNQYGDEVVADILRNDPELQATLQVHAKDASKEEGGNSNDGIARKVTGRASILPPEEQEQLFDQIADEYTALIARLDALNENTLVAKKRDLQATTKQKFVLVPGKGEGSPFIEAAHLERIEANRLGKPYPLDVVQKMVQENLGEGKRPADWFRDREAQQKALFDTYTADMYEAERTARKELDEVIKDRREFSYQNGQAAAQHKFGPLVAAAELKAEKASNRVKEALSLNNNALTYLYGFQPGRAVKVTIGKDEDVQEFQGIVLDHTYEEKAKNPLALSNSVITIAVADAVRELEIPYSQIANQKYKIEAAEPAEVRAAFGAGLTSSRENRWVITGNLLSGFNTFRKGQMILYTNDQGETREGILMAPKFNPEKELEKHAARLGAEHVVPYLKQTPQARGVANTKDGVVIISRDSSFDYVVKVKPKGGRAYYTHPDIVRIMGDFVQKGGKGFYTAKTTNPDKIAQVAKVIADKFDTSWQTDQFKDVARKLTGDKQLTEVPVQKPTGMMALRRRIRNNRAQTEQIETVDGLRDQFVLPGAEQSQEQVAQAEADRQKAELDLRAKQSKLRPGVAQQEPGGLFGEPAPKQGTLFGGMRRPTDGRTLQSVMDGLVGRFRRYDPTGKAELIFVPEIRRMIDGELYGADGHYLDRVITVALDGQDMTWTLDHEIIHYLKDMGLIRKAEWKALVRAAKNPANTTRMSPEAEANYRKAYDNDEAKVDEELVADLHAGWQRGDIDLHGLPRTVMQRIQDFFRTIWEVLTGQGFNTPESVFERIASGEVGRRAGKQRLTATQRFAAAWSGQDFGDDLSDQVGAGAGPVGDMPATPDEGLSDGARVAAKELAKALVSNTPVVKPFSGLNVEGRRMVLSVMNRLMEDQQVLDAVVGFIPIDVVNMLGGQQLTTDALLDNPSVLVDLLPVDPNDLVASGVQAMDVLAPAVAIAAAKIETGLARFDVSAADFLTASGAVRHWLTPTVAAKVPQPSTFAKDVQVQEKFGGLRKVDKAPTFFSALTRGVEGVKQPKGPAAQWSGIIDKLPGVKPAEIAWSGVKEWLAEQKGPVTKEALVEFLRANEVQVEEVEKGGKVEFLVTGSMPARFDTRKEAEDYVGKLIAIAEKDGGQIAAMINKFPMTIEEQSVRGEAKYANYVLPGGQNYRELLLKLPTKRMTELPAGFEVKENPNRGGAKWIVTGPGPLGENRYGSGVTKEQALKNFFDLHGSGPASENFTGSHFSDDKNVLGWVRFNERYADGPTPENIADIERRLVEAVGAKSASSLASGAPSVAVRKGMITETEAAIWSKAKGMLSGYENLPGALGKRVLFIEEIQSDWAQKGRKKGFGDKIIYERYVDGDLRGQHETKEEAEKYVERGKNLGVDVKIVERKVSTGVPAGPFVGDTEQWAGLAFKRALRWAAENGFDKVAWTTGDQQAERYDLSKQIGKVTVELRPKDRQDPYAFNLMAYKADGALVMSEQLAKLEDAVDYVGKDLTDKFVKDFADRKNDNWRKDYTGLDLKVGGEGMKGFYDKILPAFVSKYVKKWGAKVGKTAVQVGEQTMRERLPDATGEDRMLAALQGTAPAAQPKYETVHSVDITPEMRESVKQGQPMFALRPRAAAGPSIFGDQEQARATQDEEHEQVATPLITTLSGGALTPESVRRAVDGWRTALQDRFLPLLRTQQAIEESLGRPLRDDENAYQAETLSAGRKGAKLDDLAEDHVRPLFEDMQRRNVTVDELEMFLYARHAPERNARIASINPDFAEGEGSGMTDAEAEEIMIVAEASGKMSDLEALAARVDAIRDQALQERIDGGLLSQEQADAWTETYENYVPLRGRGELDPTLEADRPSIAKGISVRGPESRRAFGRRSRASDILAYTIMQAQEAILRAETNRVAQAFHQLAVNNPNPDFWKVNKVTTKPVWNKATGQVEQRSTSRIAAEDADYTVSLKIDGKEHRVTLNRDNPDALRLAEAMRSLKPEQISSFIRVFGGINRFLSTVNTTLNYEFVITNAFRDLQTAMVNLNQFDMPNIVSNTLKDYFPAMKAATKGAFQKFDGEWGRWYKEYRDAGGKVYFNGIEDIREQRRNVERAVKNAQPGFSARRAASQIFQVIERLNNGVENAIRLAAYKNARQAGMNVDQAAALAKNLTVNFNRRGSYGPLINSLYLFFNASVQGTATMLNAMRSPKVRKVLGAAVATGVLLALMNSMVSDDDDDGEKIYDKIPEYEKQRNLIIMEPGGKEYWKIPLPYGYNIFFNIGRNMVDLYNGKDVGKVLASQAETIVDSFNPIGGAENLLNMIAPTVADPIVDLFQNKDFTGRKIMPDQPQYGPPEPNNQRYWGSVSPISKAITDFLNEGTGGDDVVPGLIDISPEVLDYLFGQATGAAGQSWARLADWPLKVADPTSEITWNDIPMARRVQGQLGPWVNRSLFYDRAGEVALLMDNYKDYAKSGRTAEAEAFYEKNKALMGLAPMADKMRDTMSLMRRVNEAEKLARDKGEMTKEDYLKGLDERRKVETEMIAVFNNAFLVAKKER